MRVQVYEYNLLMSLSGSKNMNMCASTQIRLFANEVRKTAKNLSTLNTHKSMLTLMDQQPSDQGHAAHEYISKVCLRSFALSTLAC